MGRTGDTVIRFRRVEIGMGGHDNDGTREIKEQEKYDESERD